MVEGFLIVGRDNTFEHIDRALSVGGHVLSRFQIGFYKTDPFVAIGFERSNRDRDRAIHEWSFSARHQVKAHLLHLRFESEVYGRGVDAAANQRGQSFLRTTELQQGYVL